VYDWGGSLAVHRLTQNSDGTLNVTIAESLNNKFSSATAIGTSELNSSERQLKVFDRLPKGACKITTKIKAGTSVNFGLSFGACGNLREVYDLVFDLKNSQLRMDKNIRGQSPITTASVKLPVPANKEFDITVITEGSIAVIYVNNEIALSTRSYRMNQNPWGIFSNGGSVTFSDVKLSK
jgi:beta-fructofuranosidase